MEKKLVSWELRGKTIEQLINELNSFEDKNLKVVISVDGGVNSYPVSLVGKVKGMCLLEYRSPEVD